MRKELDALDVALLTDALRERLEDLAYFDDYTDEDREAAEKKLTHCLELIGLFCDAHKAFIESEEKVETP